VVVTLYFQFPPGAVTCADIDASAAAAVVLQRAQTLAGSTGRTFSAGPPPTCSDVPVPAGAGRRHLLQATQAVLVVKVTSVGPAPASDAVAASQTLAVAVQGTVQARLADVVDAAVDAAGYDVAAAVGQMTTRLVQVELEGQPLLYSPPPPPVAAGGFRHIARKGRTCASRCWHCRVPTEMLFAVVGRGNCAVLVKASATRRRHPNAGPTCFKATAAQNPKQCPRASFTEQPCCSASDAAASGAVPSNRRKLSPTPRLLSRHLSPALCLLSRHLSPALCLLSRHLSPAPRLLFRHLSPALRLQVSAAVARCCC
jgi:hypothetical protein